MNRRNHITLLGAAVLAVGTARAKAKKAKSVRFVYLVSADREAKAEYAEAIENAAREMQKWYAKELGGKTFGLPEPVVEVVKSDKPAMWFTTNPNGDVEASYGFRNTLDEMKRLRKTAPREDGYIWVVYSDGPGHSGRAFPGFAYLPEDDLLGLMGKHPKQKNPTRWVYGMGHELGHALGLPHPKDTKKHYDALMWAGFYKPEKAYLTDQDKEILLADTYLVLSSAALTSISGCARRIAHERRPLGTSGPTGTSSCANWMPVEQPDVAAVRQEADPAREPVGLPMKDS